MGKSEGVRLSNLTIRLFGCGGAVLNRDAKNATEGQRGEV